MRESVFKTVFLNESKNVSCLAWVKLILLEIYLGEQLLEMLVNTSSYNLESESFTIGSESNGWKKPLEDFIPATFFNRLLQNQIEELLNTKYNEHYQLMKVVDDKSLEYDSSKPLFKLNNQKLYLLTELKLAYNTIWVTLNIVIDIGVYWFTKDISLTILAGAGIEFLRRFKW
ncbi:hypothetical protein [Vibrio genomosp. F10]|uniref:hypothetical protein n=1 Tax=Vibrio genomosp. F10 TaxID=723171 RepID=UPI0002F8FAFF|nr:hypothetical protein [Vibrio genomosp. F10]OEE97772.1 hypothetical protein A1QK_12815 [Vibrio genomosp. F10 str. 9ZD137]